MKFMIDIVFEDVNAEEILAACGEIIAEENLNQSSVDPLKVADVKRRILEGAQKATPPLPPDMIACHVVQGMLKKLVPNNSASLFTGDSFKDIGLGES